MKRMAVCLLMLLIAYTAAACTSDPGCELDSAHETIPAFRPHESQDLGFEVQGVELSSEGRVLIEGFAEERAGETTRTCYVQGMSPNVMTLWPIEEQVVELGAQNEISFSFDFERRPGDPVEGYYIVTLSGLGDEIQHVFVDFHSEDWVAD
jgi:hypothetical protein